MEHKDKWKIRHIRMPSDLWWKIMKTARSRKTNCADLIRQIIIKELGE